MLRRVFVSASVFTGIALGAGAFPSTADTTPAAIVNAAAEEHPFLLVRRTDYPALQALAQVEPGKGMRARAIALAGGSSGSSDVASLVYDPLADSSIRSALLADIFSTTALAYLLDEPGRSAYRNRIIEHLRYWDPAIPGNLTLELGNDSETLATAQAGAFFNATLALDLIHDELGSDELARIHALLDAGPARYFDHSSNLKAAAPAARGAWARYRGDRFTFEKNKDDFLRDIFSAITPDGVFADGPGHAFTRWTRLNREPTSSFGDILTHLAEYADGDSETRLTLFQEWLFGYATTPSGIPWAIGDTSPGGIKAPAGETVYPPVVVDGAPKFYGFERAARFPPLASRYAARFNLVAPPASRLTSYLNLARPSDAAPNPASAPSRIFPDGGAYLRETRNTPQALAGVLSNLKTPSAHAHKEVNSIHLAGYGQLLLRGSGYNGWDTPALDFSWDYINRRAVSGNTALIDYEPLRDDAPPQRPSALNDHRDSGGGSDGKAGGGVRGFTTRSLDFSSGDSGKALPNGRHRRDFIFVHPRDAAPGYFVVFDQLQAIPGSKLANVVWHPNSATPPVITAPEKEYSWQVTPKASTALTLFLATPPAGLDLYDGVLASWGGGFVGKYLFTRYPLDPEGRRQIVTLLYPSDTARPKATFARVSAPGYTGASVSAIGGRIIDTVLELNSATTVTLPDGVKLQAASAVSRRLEGRHTFVFAREARSFRDGAYGFTSSAPVTVFLDERGGHIDSLGSIVRIHRPDLSEVIVDGVTIPLTTTGPGWIEFAVPSGSHTLEFTLARTLRAQQ